MSVEKRVVTVYTNDIGKRVLTLYTNERREKGLDFVH